MEKKGKASFQLIFITKYLHPLVLLIIIAIMGFLMYFLYQNVYKTIINAEEIAVLQQKTTIDGVDLNKFSQVLEKLKNKIVSSSTIDTDLSKISNPFVADNTSSTKK